MAKLNFVVLVRKRKEKKLNIYKFETQNIFYIIYIKMNKPIYYKKNKKTLKCKYLIKSLFNITLNCIN